jgi:glucose/arabinose dehydrogenase
MARQSFKTRLAGVASLALIPTLLAAQTPAPNPEAPKTAAPVRAPEPGADDSSVFPAPQMVEGLPFETRPPEKADDKPLFPQQTRAPYHKAADYTVTTITNKLHLPWCIAFLPDGKFLITEKENPGALRIVDKDGSISAPIAGLTTLAAPDKLGLLDVALDPNFARNKRVFFTFFERLQDGYSNTYVAHGVLDETAGALYEVTVIFRAIPAAPVKNFSMKQGGRIAFAKDGSLFLPIGDRDQGTPWMVAQQTDNDLGKIIHITQDGLPAANNPYLHKPGVLPEIWSIGTRSQEGLAFDPKTGHLWEIEHGPRGGDELNLIKPGKNYGWPIITHGIDYPGVPIGEGITAKEGLEQPVYYWDPVIAPSGLAFYKGNLFPQWKNSVFVGGLRGRMLDRLELKNDKVVAEEPLLTELHSRIRDVRVGPDGAVYVLTESDRLLKLTPK